MGEVKRELEEEDVIQIGRPHAGKHHRARSRSEWLRGTSPSALKPEI